MRQLQKYWKLILSNTELLAALLLEAGLTVYGILVSKRPGDDISANLQDALIALWVTFAVFILFELIKLIRLYRRFHAIEGEYLGYSYKRDKPEEKDHPEYNELISEPVSKARLEYVGGRELTIEVSNPPSGAVRHVWKGELKMTTDNTADIGYKYTKWPTDANLKNSAGYKRAVLYEDEDSVTIYMFSNDGQRFGREVLVKRLDS